jgi:dTDP-4-dehydrorhamnose reductase
VINAAAYTAVDKAESEPEAAFCLNRDVPAALARACAEAGVPLVHFSTDYVFDGSKAAPYVETDPVNPAGVYGASKAEGEAQVLGAGGPAIVLRTSWVYSAFGTNFVRTMLRLAATREEIGVVADQIGRPTWAEDCAQGALRAVLALMEGQVRGAELFHLAGAGDASWADFAEAIFAESAARGGPSARVKRIATADYPTSARRPANSRLDCTKMIGALDWPMRDWRLSLAACFEELETPS